MKLKYMYQKRARETLRALETRQVRSRKENENSCGNEGGLVRKEGSFRSDALVRFINLRFARKD